MGKFPIACRIIRKLVKQSNFAQKDSKIKLDGRMSEFEMVAISFQTLTRLQSIWLSMH